MAQKWRIHRKAPQLDSSVEKFLFGTIELLEKYI